MILFLKVIIPSKSHAGPRPYITYTLFMYAMLLWTLNLVKWLLLALGKDTGTSLFTWEQRTYLTEQEQEGTQ